jgi:N-acetylglucosaminyldiphosphoundecaprenol N-acetyl-beta-D-mannosaminyltransferase
MKRKHPELIVAGAESGGRLPEMDQSVMARIRESLPDILFVAFGHGKQEKWIAAALPSLPAVRVAMGVGGAFDFIAGRVKRAPKLMRLAGLEWLWRLIREPWRIRRIWTAVVVFPWLVLRSKR